MTVRQIHARFQTKRRIAAYYAGGRPTVKLVGRRLKNGDFVDRYAPRVRGVIVSHPVTGRSFFLKKETARKAAVAWIEHCKRVSSVRDLAARK